MPRTVKCGLIQAKHAGPTDVSICPFTVVAKGTIPPPMLVIVGTQAPLEMPVALQKTRKP